MSELGGTINERIGDLRTSMNLTQTELSEKTGIPISVISRIESGKTATVGHDVVAKLALFFNPNLPNLLYIGHLTYLWNPYKINVFGLFSFTFICIIDIIIFSDYTYVWGNRRGISGIFEKQKWYYIRV
jgi:transcriptional regulator with XRE-family HTH domain